MTVEEICNALGATVHVSGKPDREVCEVTVGDLLSFVMGTAPEGAAWVTIQSHLNVAAVAALKDIPLIVIASGRAPAPDLAQRCESEGIAIASAPCSIFETCAKMHSLGLKG